MARAALDCIDPLLSTPSRRFSGYCDIRGERVTEWNPHSRNDGSGLFQMREIEAKTLRNSGILPFSESQILYNS